MEREFSEFAHELEQTGLSEADEDKAVENPTVSVNHQMKASQKASAIYQKSTKTVWNAKKTFQKLTSDIFKK